METAFGGLPYRKRIPLKAHPVLCVLIPFTSLSIIVLCITVTFSQIFGMATREMLDTFLQKADVKGDPAKSWENAQLHFFFWFVAYPWRGLLLGMFFGMILVMQGNRRDTMRVDELAERLIREPLPFWRTAFRRQTVLALLAISTLIVAQICSAWGLGVSLMTSLYGAMIPMLLRYRSARAIYRLAQSKFAKALDEGLIPEGTLKPGLKDELEASFLAVGYPLFAVLTVIGLWWVWPEVREMREFGLSMAGMLMTPEDATILAEKVAHEEHDVDSRIELASFYESAAAQEGISKEERDLLREKYCGHVLWLIEHYPQTSAFIHHIRERDGDAYEVAARIWLKNAETYGNDRRVLSNAAKFFEFNDDDRALDFLRKGEMLEPGNPEWGRRIMVLDIKKQGEDAELKSPSPKSSEISGEAPAQAPLQQTPNNVR